MKNLNELKDKSYRCAVVHGWYEENLSDEHFLCLVISELMEAVEADRKGSHADIEAFNKYCDRIDFKENFERQIKGTVEEELADACIRLLSLSGLRNVNLGELDIDELKCSEGFLDWTFTESIYSIVSDMTNQAFIETHSLETHLRVSIIEIISFCLNINIDIFWFIDKKIKYNELRPYMHGGKKY